MSTVRSRKNKGKKLQNYTRDIILEIFKDKLEPDDVVSCIMGDHGIDVKLSPTARKIFPYSIECKNREKGNVWDYIEQAEVNAKENTIPMVVFKKNHHEPYVSFPMEHFVELIKIVKNIAIGENK